MLRAPIRFALLAVVALGASGCEIDFTLDGTGGGTGDVAYHIQKPWELAGQKKNLESAAVKVGSAEVDAEKLARFKLSFDDVTRLSTTQFFKTLTVKRTVRDGIVTLAGTVDAIHPVRLPEADVQYYGPDVTISLTVPGEIVDSNAQSTEGKTARWVFPLNDLLSAKKLPLTLSYKQAS